MTRLERITAMEQRLDRAVEALAALETALEGYQAVKKDIRVLTRYMESGLWLRDYMADEKGKLPTDLKRGVLSQDALYDMLTDDYRLKQTMQKLCKPTK